ncbi:3-hydroxy-3-methylglutaryl CoA synthase [Caulobacter flavus]|uniref:3-hydroxy-3-methylglutaryl CoA synthase n=1 Tax=Caulobacter flavus TaxID=1679497 RepID=A0A2N5CUL2_9CAUL|nr:3-oxoacyl-[acyl-carrier-protein] synthase III C-terminal domain-containing protein [Caulobacter flavus]AYV47789.1 3-hydroxy-3-methylglutaryl CoA synthase [Caulobacter flavus]PLR16952.1 3-hydroxy-3-methylglutaryl CoA synthase [Caulobacter flavus]
MVGIAAWGAYAPRLRLSRKAVVVANAWIAPGLAGKAKGERSMANWDEDALTMAVEAARDALGVEDEGRAAIEGAIFASTTAPFADRQNAGILAAALTLEPTIASADVTGSQRCGLTALGQALDAAASGRRVLVAVGEHRRARAASPQELDFGDAAAAFVVSPDGAAAEFLGRGTVTDDFVDHFRGADAAFDYAWEERWIRDEGIVKLVPPAIRAALDAAGVDAAQVDHFCFPSTFAGMGATLAKTLGIRPDAVRDTLAAQLGEAGAAHGPLLLAHALEEAQPGQIVLVAQFGQGAEALVFRAGGEIGSSRPARGVAGALADRQEETNYLKFLVFNDLVEWDRGMRAEKDNKTALTTLYRNRDQILGLVGGRCRETGVVQFPRTRISVAPNNPAVDTQEPYRFAERAAQVLTYSADYLTFSMSPPNHYGMIVFEGGGRIMLDITDVTPGEVETGLPVKMVFRIKDRDEKRGFVRYFWKAAPDRAAMAAVTAQAAE